MDSVVIIGGGIAGLSTAYHLEQQGFADYHIFEKDAQVGGLCKSFVIDDFTFDCAIHVLYSGNKYVKELIESKLLKENLNSQIRKSFIYYKNVYTEYPFQAHLYGQDPAVIKDCILGLIEARYGDKLKAGNFEDWIYATFGSGIGQHFMLPYNEKQWAIDLKKMSCDWIVNRVPVPEVEDTLEGALKPPQKKYGPNANFWYPLKGGIGSLPNGFLPYIRNVNLNSKLSGISLAKKEVEVNGGKLRYDKLFPTIPLPQVVSLIADDIPPEVRRAAESLEYNAVCVVNLAIDRPDISGYHWVYFPEEKYIFHRISFPMNLSPFMAPHQKSSITAEIAFSKYKPLKMSQKEIIKAVIAGLIKCAVINKSDRILFRDLSFLDPAYVIYTPYHKRDVGLIHNYLNRHGVYPCGRFGDWEYWNMDQTILSGKKAAELVTGNLA